MEHPFTTTKRRRLSTECVHASSVNTFKNRIDKYLVKAGCTHKIRESYT